MRNYIPEEATINISAKAYYESVKELERLQEVLEEQENALEIYLDQESSDYNDGGHQIRLIHHKYPPFGKEMACAAGNLLASDDASMDLIFKRGQYWYQPYYSHLDSYEWGAGFDLRKESPLFNLAWKRAGRRKKELYDEHHPTSAEIAYEEAIIEAEGRTL